VTVLSEASGALSPQMAPVARQEILDASPVVGAEHSVVHLAAAELARGGAGAGGPKWHAAC